MIILLHHDLLGAVDAMSERDAVALDRIISACYDGSHYITAKNRILIQKMLLKSIGIRTNAVLQRILSNYAQHHAVYKDSYPQIIVSYTAIRVTKVANQWTVPLHMTNILDFQKLTILAEDLKDAKLFVCAAHHYQQTNRELSNIPISCIPVGGGGENIDVEYENKVKQNLLVVCLTDGDFRYPEAEKSRKTKKCDAIQQSGAITLHLNLPVREIENLFPLEVIEEISEAKTDDPLTVYKRYPTAWKHISAFIDIKATLEPCAIDQLKDTREREFWSNFVNQFSNENKGTVGWKHHSHACCGKKSCAFPIWLGKGERITAKILDALENNNGNDFRIKLTKTAKWVELGKEVFEWAISQKEIRI